MSLVWLRVAVALYGAAALISGLVVWRPSTALRAALQPLVIAGALFHFVSYVELLNANHHWVPVGLHELESFIALAMAAIFIWAFMRYKSAALGVFILPIVFLLALAPAIGPEFQTIFAPNLRNGWVFAHIALVLTAYSALLFSLIVSLVYLVQERELKHKHVGGLLRWLPPLEVTGQIASRLLVFGFPLMTLGLLTGSLLAEATTGPAYFRDPKVILAFAMWVMYVMLLWMRRRTGMRGRRAAYVSCLVFLLALSVWAANQLSTVHRYTTP
jgi:ABC-type uncharacterized transport system permease subunit